MYGYKKWWNRDITVVELANFMVQEVNFHNFMSLIRNTSAYKILRSVLYISPHFITQSNPQMKIPKTRTKDIWGPLRYSYSALLHEKNKEPSNQGTFGEHWIFQAPDCCRVKCWQTILARRIFLWSCQWIKQGHSL